jgi:phenylacetic acid degradation operon negative regulatory protein
MSAAKRRQGGFPTEGTARSLLLTVLGELVAPAQEPIWTLSLLYVLTGLGVSEQTARQTLSRVSNAGWLASERVGREVCWSATPLLVEILDDISRRVESINVPEEHWDGNGIFLNVIIPQEKKVLRKRLYNALSWAGFGNPMPGLWANPHVDRFDEVKAIIDELGLRDTTILSIGRLADCGLTAQEIIERSWNLDEVAAQYGQLLKTYQDMDPRPGDDVLLSYLSLVHEWRKFPSIDPQLPRDVLPDWIGRTASNTFVTLRARWEPGMRDRWTEVVGLTAPQRPRTPCPREAGEPGWSA